MGGCISRKKRSDGSLRRRASPFRGSTNPSQINNNTAPISHNYDLFELWFENESSKRENNISLRRNSSLASNSYAENEENIMAPVPPPRTKRKSMRENFKHSTNIANISSKCIQKEKYTDKITPFNKLEHLELAKKQINITEVERPFKKPVVHQKYIDDGPSSNLPRFVDYTSDTIVYSNKQYNFNSSKNTDNFMKPRLVHENNYVQRLYKDPLEINCILQYNKLEPYTPSYDEVRIRFTETGKRNMHIISIDQIINPYIQMLYALKKYELETRMNVTERLLFHGTTRHKIDSICSNNFDHRLSGTATGSRFGRGVSFSPISFYATHYCDKKSKEKVMLLCKVMEGNSHFGNKLTYVPDEGFDTTTNHNRHVIVKYDDDVFCPEYVIHFMFI